MRSSIVAVILLLLSASPLLAQQTPPAPEITIFLSPLRVIGDDGKSAWISQAVQQNVLSDLTRLQSVRPILPATPPADHEAAIKAAKAAGANLLLEGSYQLADPGIRITIQILDLRTNQYIGAAKATGPLAELFALEDSIADQVKRIALKQLRLQAPPAAPQQALPPVAIPGNGPVQMQFPWDRDKPFLAQAKRQTILDSEYEASLYRNTYTYGCGCYNYYGYGSYYRPYYGGLTFFPGGMIRGRGAFFFPGGVVNIGW